MLLTSSIGSSISEMNDGQPVKLENRAIIHSKQPVSEKPRNPLIHRPSCLLQQISCQSHYCFDNEMSEAPTPGSVINDTNSSNFPLAVG